MADVRFYPPRRKAGHRTIRPEGSGNPAPASDTGTGLSAAALVEAIPCPALVVNADRRIGAVNAPLCDAFGLHAAFLYAGEPFADFACRTSLSGGHGLLALGDLLSDESGRLSAEIAASNGTTYTARACPLPQGAVLITMSALNREADSDTGRIRNRTGYDIAVNIIHNMPGAILRLVRDRDGAFQCVFAGPQSPALFGRSTAELTRIDRDFREFIVDRHRSSFEREMGRHAHETAAVDVEIQVHHASQGPLWVRCVGAALPKPDGSTVFDVRMIDIEERRTVLEERQRLQNLLDMVVDNIPLMVSVRDIETRAIVIVNRAFEETIGCDRQQVLGRSDVCLCQDGDATHRIAQQCAELQQGHIIDLPELHVHTPRKGMRIVKSRKYPLYGEDGRVRYVLAITEDITDRRTAENALRRNEQRFRDAIESLTDGIALFDSAERLVLCNRRYRAMWPSFDAAAQPGATFESLVREYLKLATEHGRRIDVEAELAARLARYRNPPSTCEIPLFNGRWLQVADRMTADGGVVVTCTDITALKEREAGLRRASQQALFAKEAAEGANRSKSDFLANMSHELRTPLNAVIGFSEIIRDALLGDHSIEPYRGYAQDIYESGRHLLDLINDILDMSKIEAGKLELVEEPVDLVAAIEASLRLVKDRAHQNGVALATELPTGLPRIQGDLRKIKQIAINLLSNAVKFTPEGGRVTVSLARADDGGVLLRVADTGIGIRAEDIEKVLAPFGQADAGLNRHYEGTGLGLTLTKALTELHGGRLEIESSDSGPLTGTTVTAFFPAERVIG